ncbi:hypothetical protein BpHYR1_053689 [Brachionus plicatilis]|uniref:Uncharacterized protein n=1 Tax=Brachionus plicatilis TaxID=10195 RepID=A0A3M7SGF1_BRAPC|nr:hypothetical protein BpHYR1_053689 [Brachionus plicatilis]
MTKPTGDNTFLSTISNFQHTNLNSGQWKKARDFLLSIEQHSISHIKNKIKATHLEHVLKFKIFITDRRSLKALSNLIKRRLPFLDYFKF